MEFRSQAGYAMTGIADTATLGVRCRRAILKCHGEGQSPTSAGRPPVSRTNSPKEVGNMEWRVPPPAHTVS